MSYEFDENFDVIVVGAGHAGVEASLAARVYGDRWSVKSLR